MINLQVDAEKWGKERNALRDVFNSGKIISAQQDELEHYLIVLANTQDVIGNIDKIRYESETESFSIVVRHLLQVRLGEKLHAKTYKISILALIVSAIAVVIALLSHFHYC